MRRELQSTHIVVDHRIVAIFHILHVCSATNRLISVSPAFPAGRDTAGAPRQRAGDFFRFFNGQRSTHQTTKTRLLKLDENWKQNEFCYRFSFHKRVAFEAEIWHSICGLLVFSACHVKWQENLNHIIYLNPIYNPQPSAKKHLESGQFLDIWDKRCHLLSRWKRLISSPWWNYRDPHWFKTSSDDKKRRRRPSWDVSNVVKPAFSDGSTQILTGESLKWSLMITHGCKVEQTSDYLWKTFFKDATAFQYPSQHGCIQHRKEHG